LNEERLKLARDFAAQSRKRSQCLIESTDFHLEQQKLIVEKNDLTMQINTTSQAARDLANERDAGNRCFSFCEF
jgi:uncharacterized protein (DUF1786 family)